MDKLDELIIEIKEKEKNGENIQKEISSIILEFDPTISIIASEFNNVKGLEKDDFLQEGRLAVWKAINSYNPNKTASFKTFASTCVRNAMLDLIRKHNKINSNNIDSIYNDEDFGEDVGPSPESYAISKEFQDKINKELDNYEKKVLDLYLDDCSYEEIANNLNKSIKDIDNSLQKIKKKIKGLIN